MVAVLAALALSFLGLAIGPKAFAANAGPYTIDGTNMNGSLVTPDHASVTGATVTIAPDGFGAVKELGPKNGNDTKVGVIQTAAVPMLNYTNPNAQVDLRQAWLSTARDGSNNIWQYFAWERDSNSGSGFLAFEFNQKLATNCTDPTNPDPASCNPWTPRTNGDFMIVWDQSGNSTDLQIRYWVGDNATGHWDAPATITADVGKAAFNTNDAGIQGYKGEAAVNLTELFFKNQTGCTSIARVLPNTVTGNSDSADYKDTIFTAIPPISNCGTITVKKTVTNLPSGATPSFDFTTTNLTPGSFSLGDGGSKAFTDLFAGTYQVAEEADSGMPANYKFVSLSCTGGADTSTTDRTATINLSAGENVVCTYTNTHFKNKPTIATTLSSESVTVGDSVHDSSALTGATATAGGTVTYTVYTDTSCSLNARDAGTKTVTNGVVPDSNSLAFNTPGDYYWQASYSGDADNEAAKSVCTSEHLVVNKAPASLTTAQKWRPQDSVTVAATAGGTPTGTVDFKLYDNSTCSGAPVYQQLGVALSSGQASTTNTTYDVSATKTVYWLVSYSGDSNHNAIAGSCGSENTALTVTNGGTVNSQ